MISERTFAQSFDAFWHELLPLLTPRFMALFNEAYESILKDDAGRDFTVLPVRVERADIVAEFGFRAACIANLHKITVQNVFADTKLAASAESQALDLICRYEGSKPDEAPPLNDSEREEGLALALRYQNLYAAFPPNSVIQFCPQLCGAGFLNPCEADLVINDTLIEVKTTKKKPSGKDLRQLTTYLALDSGAQNRGWTHIGIFNPRRGTLHRAHVDPLMLRLSGGKPRSDVFADLVSFAESNDLPTERRF
jgi:hypothetical protein